MKDSVVAGCDHIGMMTNRPDRLIDFYRDKLGFTVEKEDILPSSLMKAIFGVPSRCRFVKMACSGEGGTVFIEIFHPLTAVTARRQSRAAGINHWGFRVGSREEFCRLLRRRGVPVIEVSRNSRTIYFIRDPDGNRVEIRT
jgi:catechol 2,3-dioxygenase-like lactoylglutathione lyase family enzyme